MPLSGLFHSTRRTDSKHGCGAHRKFARRAMQPFRQPSALPKISCKIEHDQHPAVAQQGGAVDSRHAGQQALGRLQHDVHRLAQAIDLKAAQLAGDCDDQHVGVACGRAPASRPRA